MSIFRKSAENIQVSSRSDKGTLREDQYIFSAISRPSLLRMRYVSDKRRRNQNTQFLLNNFFFFQESCRLCDNVEKYCTAREVTDYNMVHVHCTLDTEGYKHTLRICNTYCLSIATVVTRMRLYITLRYTS